jgi:hypothetical protein
MASVRRRLGLAAGGSKALGVLAMLSGSGGCTHSLLPGDALPLPACLLVLSLSAPLLAPC